MGTTDQIPAEIPIPRHRRPGGGARASERRLRPFLVSVVTGWGLRRALCVVIALAGVAVLTFPMTMNWFHARTHTATERAYATTVQNMTPERVRSELARAHAYNKHLPVGAIVDPYAASPDGSAAPSGPDAQRYLDTLDIGPNSMMATLSIPAIGLSLPIYHGTDPATLDRGVGHLFGSALPVGGAGTHAVLTGHSGIPGDTLFTNLHKLHLGDEFSIEVLDQTLTYRVDQVLTVLPNQTSALRPVAGRDYVTLVTCTPIGVNSHRLLVRGVRVPTPASSGTASSRPSIRLPGAGLPWWILIDLATIIAVLVVTEPLAPRRGPRP